MFVDAYSSATGRPVRIPEHFLDHPVIGKGFRKTPPSASNKSTARTHQADKTPAAGEKE